MCTGMRAILLTCFSFLGGYTEKTSTFLHYYLLHWHTEDGWPNLACWGWECPGLFPRSYTKQGLDIAQLTLAISLLRRKVLFPIKIPRNKHFQKILGQRTLFLRWGGSRPSFSVQPGYPGICFVNQASLNSEIHLSACPPPPQSWD